MQLYAIDLKGRPISARQALRQTDYRCIECNRVVRLRGGPHRQSHFYHLDPTPLCRQHQKGPVHLRLQSYFLDRLPPGDCRLEVAFPSIGRIADVAWLSEKIIFEIQCSPIKAEEVLARNSDYRSQGWEIVWILHDQRYNQLRVSGAERVLRASPHFFSNMDASGSGIIYDQFAICEEGIRKKRLSKLPVNLTERPLRSLGTGSYPMEFLKRRAADWNVSFSGDLLNLFLNDPEHQDLRQALEFEKQFYSSMGFSKWREVPFRLWEWGVVNPYRILFRHLLEKICR